MIGETNIAILKNSIFEMLRFDHWIKSLILVPGFFLCCSITKKMISLHDYLSLLIALLVYSLAASTNYFINEYLDKDADKYHPIKKARYAVRNELSPNKFRQIYIFLFMLPIFLCIFLARNQIWLLIFFEITAIFYNVKPFRFKDRVFLDIFWESINNPIRLIAGWLSADSRSIPPSSLILSLWLMGFFLMSAKRISEVVFLNNFSEENKYRYRKSFKYYNLGYLLSYCTGSSALFFVFWMIFGFKYSINTLYITPFLVLFFSNYLKSIINCPKEIVEKPHTYFDKKLFAKCLLLLIAILISSKLLSLQNMLNFIKLDIKGILIP